MKVFAKYNYQTPRHEDFIGVDRSELLPADRVPSLLRIMQQFKRGNGDTSLIDDLPFNDLERNPFFSKNFDLADYPDIANEIDSTIAEVDRKIREAKIAKEGAKTDIVPTDGMPSE